MNDDRTAPAALTRLFEPGDTVGLALVAKHGAHAALRIAIGARPAYPFADVTAEQLADVLGRWRRASGRWTRRLTLLPLNVWAADS